MLIYRGSPGKLAGGGVIVQVSLRFFILLINKKHRLPNNFFFSIFEICKTFKLINRVGGVLRVNRTVYLYVSKNANNFVIYS